MGMSAFWIAKAFYGAFYGIHSDTHVPLFQRVVDNVRPLCESQDSSELG